MKRCVLQSDKVCNECGTCDDRCELDPNKICDNCFRCLDEGMEAFAQIPIAGVYLDDDFSPENLVEISLEDDPDDGFVPDLSDDWKDDEIVHATTLPMTYGARVCRSHERH